ncbi:MAG: NBR1-Ig-like domain-containing protein, partial [Anaerolineae bacterium]|nr:NBR1-Ig-like domain-containing protein [Anaerolineae bacterium]
LRNSGSCTWNSSYSLVFDSGDAMGGPAAVQLTTGTVAPNQTVDVSVDLTAPSDAGTYRGNWKLRNSSGVVFGLGASNGPFFVEIDVVAAVNFSMEFDNTHMCGGLVYATVKITNIGSEFLHSARIRVRDLDTDTNLYGPASNNKPFVTTPTGCPPGNNDADPGESYYIAVSIGAAPPSGHEARYTLMLCTEDSLAGTCVEKSIVFEIP